MLTRLTHSQMFVLDHQQALDFYVGILGLEVRSDYDLGFMRWVTIGAPGDEGREVLLEVPGAPALDDATAATVRQLVTKGAGGGQLIFGTSDCRATYEKLRARGVEFSEEPTERFYGIDCALRDPFGNSVRIVQHFENPVVPAPGEFTP